MDIIKNAIAAYIAASAFKDVTTFMQFNNLVLPGGNMGIPRSQMPQIAGDRLDDFISHLQRLGIKVTRKKVPTADLKLTQGEYNKFKVMKLMKLYSQGKKVHPVIVSSDGFVLDGSHRFIAQHNNDPKGSIDVLQANVKMKDLLFAARKYAGATYRNVSDKAVDK